MSAAYVEPTISAAPETGVRFAKYVPVILMLFMGVGAILFYALLSGQSLRLDEAQSLWQASRTPSGIFRLVGQDVHVPLYHILLHYWLAFFGTDVVTGRLFSLLFYLAAIPATYALGKLAYGRMIGLFAAFLVSVSPFLTWYASEIRMYSLLTFLTVLNQYFFLRIYKRNAGWGSGIGFALTAVLGIYTHYFFACVLLSEFVFVLFHRKMFTRKALTLLFSGWALAGISLLPWVLYVRSLGSASNTQPMLTTPTAVSVFNTFSNFLFGFQGVSLNTFLVSLWPLAMLLALFAIQKGMKFTPVTRYFSIATFLPIILIFLASVTVRPLYESRYLILTVPTFYLLLGWILATYPLRLSRGLAAFIALAMTASLTLQTVSAANPLKENYRDVSTYLETKATARDVALVSAPFTLYPIEYYYDGPLSIQTIPSWDPIESASIPAFSEDAMKAQVAGLKKDHTYAWVVLSYDQGYETDVRLYFDQNYQRISERRFSDDLTVYQYQLRYDD